MSCSPVSKACRRCLIPMTTTRLAGGRHLGPAEFLLAAAGAVGDQRLIRAIAPLVQRAALGDGYEMTPGARHGLKRAVAPDWPVLVSIMRPAGPRSAGMRRRWAVRDLGILRDVQAVGELVSALGGEQPRVRPKPAWAWACSAGQYPGRGRRYEQTFSTPRTTLPARSAVAHNGPSKRSPDRKEPTVKRTPRYEHERPSAGKARGAWVKYRVKVTGCLLEDA
jgi:hypothetical protein